LEAIANNLTIQRVADLHCHSIGGEYGKYRNRTANTNGGNADNYPILPGLVGERGHIRDLEYLHAFVDQVHGKQVDHYLYQSNHKILLPQNSGGRKWL